jgi:hypothetical protein
MGGRRFSFLWVLGGVGMWVMDGWMGVLMGMAVRCVDGGA